MDTEYTRGRGDKKSKKGIIINVIIKGGEEIEGVFLSQHVRLDQPNTMMACGSVELLTLHKGRIFIDFLDISSIKNATNSKKKEQCVQAGIYSH